MCSGHNETVPQAMITGIRLRISLFKYCTEFGSFCHTYFDVKIAGLLHHPSLLWHSHAPHPDLPDEGLGPRGLGGPGMALQGPQVSFPTFHCPRPALRSVCGGRTLGRVQPAPIRGPHSHCVWALRSRQSWDSGSVAAMKGWACGFSHRRPGPARLWAVLAGMRLDLEPR